MGERKRKNGPRIKIRALFKGALVYENLPRGGAQRSHPIKGGKIGLRIDQRCSNLGTPEAKLDPHPFHALNIFCRLPTP